MASIIRLKITWQQDILAALLSNVDTVRQAKGILKPIYFTSVPYRWLCKKIFNHYENYNGSLLEKRSLIIELKKYIKDPDEYKAYRTVLLPLYKSKIAVPHIIENIQDWARIQSFALLLNKAAKLGEQGNLKEAEEAITSSFLFDVTRKDYILRDYTETWQARQRYRKDLKEQAKEGVRKQVRFNLGPLDDVCQIFTDTSALVVLAATSGIGKSIFSINIGANSFLNDLKVAHFVFENILEQAEGRYDSRILNHSYRDLMRYNWAKKKLNKAVRQMRILRRKFKNNLQLIHFPLDTCSIIDTERVLRELELSRGWKPDVIIYDSLDHMLPSAKQENHRLNVSKVYKDAKRQSEIRRIPVITTSHLKASERHQLARQEGFSESYDKARLADVWITISQTIEQEDNQEAVFFLDKNRDDVGNLKLLVDLVYETMFLDFREVFDGGYE